MMKKEFGPMRENKYLEIGKSNMFIGNFLRFFWLLEEKEYNRVVEEVKKCFSVMADTTGTLWELDRPTASCNHGFASSVSVIMMASLFGYNERVKNRFDRYEYQNGYEKLTLTEN